MKILQWLWDLRDLNYSKVQRECDRLNTELKAEVFKQNVKWFAEHPQYIGTNIPAPPTPESVTFYRPSH